MDVPRSFLIKLYHEGINDKGVMEPTSDLIVICKLCKARVRKSRLDEHIFWEHFDSDWWKRQEAKSSTLLVECPYCGCPVRATKLKSHYVKCPIKKNLPVRTARPAVAINLPKSLEACATCGIRVRPEAMNRHIANYHSAEILMQSGPIVERLPFDLLRPGKWDLNDLKGHLRQECAKRSAFEHDLEYEPHRLEQIMAWNPTKCFVGSASWSGYVVFEFGDCAGVVLECPYRGNASYVLFGDWRNMVRKAKWEVRREFDGQFVKVVHKGEWSSRILEALGPKLQQKKAAD